MTYLFADRNGFVIQAVDSGDKIDPIQSSPGMNRAFSAALGVALVLGRCPRLFMNIAPLALKRLVISSISAKGAISSKPGASPQRLERIETSAESAVQPRKAI